MSTLVVTEVDTIGALLALEPEWRALEEVAENKLPFLTFDWVTTWWDHFRADRYSIKDNLFVRSIRTPEGELVAVAPLMLTERPAMGPVRVRAVQYFGADPNITELRGLLVTYEHEQDAQQALHDNLMECADQWDWVQWTGVQADSATQELLDQNVGVTWRRDVSNFILQTEPTWEAQRARLRRNIKQSIRKCYNSLKRDGHEYTFEVVRATADIDAGLVEFFRLHSARADLVGTVDHPDVFKADTARAFLEDVFTRYADRDMARIFQLRIGDEVVATRLGFALGKTLYLYYSGFDPEWAKYSVSTTVVVEAIKYAIGAGFEEVNLSTGNDVSKTRWGPREVVYREAHMGSGQLRGKMALAGYHFVIKSGESSTVLRLLKPLLKLRSAA